MDFPHFFIVDFPLKNFENIVIGHFPFLLLLYTRSVATWRGSALLLLIILMVRVFYLKRLFMFIYSVFT